MLLCELDAGITWLDVGCAARRLRVSLRCKVDAGALFRELHHLIHGADCTCEPSVHDKLGWKRWQTFVAQQLPKGLRRELRNPSDGITTQSLGFNFATWRVCNGGIEIADAIGSSAVVPRDAQQKQADCDSERQLSGEESEVIASLLAIGRATMCIE